MSSGWTRRLHRTVGLRVALWYAAVFAASIAAFVVVTYLMLATSLEQRDQEIVVATLREYAGDYVRGGLRGVSAAVEREQRAGRRERLFVRVVSTQGEAVFMSLPPEWGPFAVDRMAEDNARGSAGAEWMRAPSAERPADLEVASVRMPDGALLQVGKSTESRDDLLRRFRRVLLAVTGIVLVTGLLGGIALTRSAMQPVRRLATAVRTIIATGRTDVRVDTEASGDPLDELGVLVNSMLERITRLVQTTQDSLDNVAHDLKTPLARLRGRAEEALASSDPEVRAEALAGCIADTDRITAMLDTLMDIAEARSGVLRLRLERGHVGTLVQDVVDLYADAAEDQGVSLVAECPDDGWVVADQARLRRAVANLVDNAIKYTSAGGTVRVEGDLDESRVMLTVTDTGTGIDPDDLSHIWERLYRGDRSRSSQGLGLGLSLVRAFVEAHGGRVEVESAPGQGSRFRVILPADGPPAASVAGEPTNLAHL